MKQVININFQGRVVPIEVTAFEILKNYTDSLNRFFESEIGRDEIINDIESRIGELFQERLKAGSTCISDDDVNAIIRSMGRPEDFETDDSNAEAANARQASSAYSSAGSFNQSPKDKRLYRDENNKVFGGVCSGLANYFNVDVVIVRIIFVILFFSFGFGLIPYLIMWIAVPSSATTEIGSVRKKLYRDSDHKIVAGVCSGIGNYFGINAWIPRIIFLLPLLSFFGRFGWHGDFDFPGSIGVGFSPGALIIYIILWLVIPEAFSTAEKLEMKGEKVDMNSIKNSVVEEMKGVQQRAEKFGREASVVAAEKGKAMGTEIGSIAKRGGRSIGDIIALLFKIFAYFILGCLGFAVVAASFGLGIFAIGVFPMKEFMLTDGLQNLLAWGTLIFFIATPIIGFITWLIRKLAKIRSNSKIMRASFIGFWVIGLICLIALIVSVGKDFRTHNTLVEQEIALANPGISRLEISSLVPDQKYFDRRWFHLEPFEGIYEDTAFVKNISINIVKSTNDSFKVTMMKVANGRTRRYADTLASLIDFRVEQRDSILLIDKGIAINRTDKFRNQQVVITIHVPVGKKIMVNKSVGLTGKILFEGPWNNRYRDLEFDEIEQGWDTDKEYIMREDGLYSLDGIPADTWNTPETNINEDGIHYNDGDTRIQIDENGIRIESDKNGKKYRYEQNGPNPGVVDSLRRQLESDQFKLRDSLERMKNKIDAELNNINKQVSNKQPVMLFSMASYNPLGFFN